MGTRTEMRRGAPFPLHGADLAPISPLLGGRLLSSPPVLVPSSTLLLSPPHPSLSILTPSLYPWGERSPCLVLREREREWSGESSGIIRRKHRCAGPHVPDH
ncbi:hypothetical protein Q8A73_022599 [Channa argus]|nr:hypothetical protein Q8A73_022599 [Channa argus]